MNFKFKSNAKNKSASDIKTVGSLLLHFWLKIHIALFFALLLGFIAFGWYTWKKNLYGGGWSEEKKQEYLNTQNKAVIFKEKDFRGAITNVQERKKSFEEKYEPMKDVFKAY